MTFVDGIIICITLLSAILGLARGFSREILSLASWICAGILTFTGMSFVKSIAHRYIENTLIADGAAIVGLFVILLALFSLISHMLSGLIRHSVLGGLDRSLGFLFGIVRGVVVLCCFQLTVSCFISTTNYPEILKTNRFLPLLTNGGSFMLSLMPNMLAQLVQEKQAKLTANPAKPLTGNTQQGTKNAPTTGTGLIENIANEAIDSVVTNLNNTVQKATTQSGSNLNNKKGAANQLEAEKLARLQPRITESTPEPQGASSRQEKDLDRFMNTPGVDATDDVGAEDAQ